MDVTFTRKEACELTDLTGAQADYLCTKGVVVPQKIGSPNRPTVLYTWIQTIELKIVSKLRKRQVPTKFIYGFLSLIRHYAHDLTLQDKYILTTADLYLSTAKIDKDGKGGIYTNVNPLTYYRPEKFSVEVENYGGGYVDYIIFTKEELESWMSELIDNAGYMGFEVISPLGDIVSEIKEAAEKHNVKIKLPVAA